MNGDGMVDDADLLVVLFNFGNGCLFLAPLSDPPPLGSPRQPGEPRKALTSCPAPTRKGEQVGMWHSARLPLLPLGEGGWMMKA